MEITEMAILGAKYIVALIANSKAGKAINDDVVEKSIGWVKKHVFKIKPALEKKVEEAKTIEEKEQALQHDLKTLLEQPDFRAQFMDWLKAQQANPVIRNYLNVEMDELDGDFQVGNQNSSSPAQQVTTVNDADAKIKKMTGNLHVGNK